jgi:hypothetical protein
MSHLIKGGSALLSIASSQEPVIQFPTLARPGRLLGHGAMAAQQTLDLFILVRIRMPQPVNYKNGFYGF